MPCYIPCKGDFIYLSFDPQSGHEQQDHFPVLVISNDLFTKSTGLAIVCPITKTDREIPFHLPIPKGLSLTGFVMVDQVKSFDYKVRQAAFIDKAPKSILEDALAILDVCVK